MLVSPLVGLGSVESDYVRAAAELGVPTVLVVASWDNLTNKGLIRDVPTLTIVWNEMQVEEAVRLHKIPEERVIPVGAHSFDHWFSWEPSLNRKEFAKRMRLDPKRPLVLYLGLSYFIAGDETPFVREWLHRVREHPRLQDSAVILRPHPQNVVGWDVLDVDERGKTVVWPRAGEAPTSERQKTDYFDTLFHSSAMVGINTTALIEASILHRPVLTLVNETFQTQEGTLHFAYIAAECNVDGLVTVARSWTTSRPDRRRDRGPRGDKARSEDFCRASSGRTGSTSGRACGRRRCRTGRDDRSQAGPSAAHAAGAAHRGHPGALGSATPAFPPDADCARDDEGRTAAAQAGTTPEEGALSGKGAQLEEGGIGRSADAFQG